MRNKILFLKLSFIIQKSTKFTEYTLEPDMKYVYFSKNDESDLSFDEPGFYRVFLLDDEDETVASGVIEIIDK